MEITLRLEEEKRKKVEEYEKLKRLEAAGKHKKATKAFFCDACEPGRFGAGAVNQSAAAYCQPCAAGQIQKASGNTTCGDCGTGQYQPALGQTSCLAVQTCQKGTYETAAPSTSSRSTKSWLWTWSI